jgi:type VI protein secretion system component VasF
MESLSRPHIQWRNGVKTVTKQGHQMDHQEQHHLHHQKEREHEKKEHKAHEHKQEERMWGFHPAWFVVLGIVLILLVVAVWTSF